MARHASRTAASGLRSSKGTRSSWIFVPTGDTPPRLRIGTVHKGYCGLGGGGIQKIDGRATTT